MIMYLTLINNSVNLFDSQKKAPVFYRESQERFDMFQLQKYHKDLQIIDIHFLSLFFLQPLDKLAISVIPVIPIICVISKIFHRFISRVIFHDFYSQVIFHDFYSQVFFHRSISRVIFNVFYSQVILSDLFHE